MSILQRQECVVMYTLVEMHRLACYELPPKDTCARMKISQVVTALTKETALTQSALLLMPAHCSSALLPRRDRCDLGLGG